MPHLTRSRRQANVVLEDEAGTDDVAQQDLAAAPLAADRAPLSAIDANSEEFPVLDLEAKAAPNNSRGKGKKGKGGRKGTKKRAVVKEEMTSITPTIVDDENAVVEPKAVTEACSDLKQSLEKESPQVPMYDQRSTTPPSPAAQAARKYLEEQQESHSTPTSNDTEGDKEQDCRGDEVGDCKEDSFVGHIETRSPIKSDTSLEEFPKYEEPSEQQEQLSTEEATEDSFVNHITGRSPAKSTTRPEDSLEAMDNLEDAIDQIDKALTPITKPASAQIRARPTGTTTAPEQKAPEKKQTTRPSVRQGSPKRVLKKAHAANTPRSTRGKVSIPASKPTAGTVRNPATPSKTKTTTKPAPGTQKKDEGELSKGTETAMATSGGPLATSKQHRVSVSFPPPPPPAKSSKPPTRSTFELPGEAISRRLKEQREERQKREKEEQQRKREFKAKPVRKTTVPAVAVRPTATSQARARASIVDGSTCPAADSQDKTATADPASRGSSAAPAKRQSSLHLPKRTQRASGPAITTTSRKPSLPSIPRKPSVAVSSRNPSGPVEASTVTPADVLQQRQRAREIFSRDKNEKTERERARKEKEAAARRAREEAAERGRATSREWAERQKKKALAGKAEGGP
ncbi:MAG: hypothetical protein M1837_004803 [Sclerophora amabilis]|nr:MAG: hypothetical protein M1837_004803 [Sclerophora amabilis]